MDKQIIEGCTRINTNDVNGWIQNCDVSQSVFLKIRLKKNFNLEFSGGFFVALEKL